MKDLLKQIVYVIVVGTIIIGLNFLMCKYLWHVTDIGSVGYYLACFILGIVLAVIYDNKIKKEEK